MARRVGLGPVFAFEWLMASRRWQAYAMRSLTVLLLLGVMALVWYAWPEATIARQAEMGKVFYRWTAMILLGLVGLAAPAATAGAICQDKARGNLTLLFATDLSDAEIVLGKLAARLVPVLGMILCVAPVLSIATLFGGIDPVGADRGLARGALLRGLRLLAGADAVGLGEEDARGADGDLRLRHPLPAGRTDLRGHPGDAPRGVAGVVAALVLGHPPVQPDLPGAGDARRAAPGHARR